MNEDLRGVAAAVAACVDRAVWPFSDAALAERLDLVRQAQRQLDAVGLTVVRELEGRDLARRDGASSLPAWLRGRQRMSIATANRTVRLARALDAALPATRDALAKGELDTEQAWEIKRAVEALPSKLDPQLVAEAEAALVEQARRLDPRALRTVGERILQHVAPEIAEEHERRRLERQTREAWERRRLTFTPDGDGGVRISGLLDAETAAYVQASIDALAAPRNRKRPRWAQCPPAPSAGEVEPDVGRDGGAGAGVAGSALGSRGLRGPANGSEAASCSAVDGDVPGDRGGATGGDAGCGGAGCGGAGSGLRGHGLRGPAVGSDAAGCGAPGGGVRGDRGRGGIGDGDDFGGRAVGGGAGGDRGRGGAGAVDDVGGRGGGGGDGVGGAVWDERTVAQRRADALREICMVALASGELPDHGGDRPSLVVTVDYDALSRQLGVGTLDGGERLAPETVRRLACDAKVIPAVLDGRGQPLDLGRERRLFTGAIRRALALRDGGCCFPGCDRPPKWCEGHHVTSWERGGSTGKDNGCLLCSYHHHVIHEGDWLVRMAADGRPEFIPPTWVDPERRPQRNHYVQAASRR